MSTTLSSHLSRVAPGSSSDLEPLVANETYRRAVDRELASREAAAAAAARVVEFEDSLANGIQPFAAAMSGIRAAARRFPEASTILGEAATLVQRAMGVVAHNPQPLETPAEARADAAQGASPEPAPSGPPAWKKRKWAQQQQGG
jgi:hypothetical protein